jgi:gliding motility-associated-like protein
MKKNTLLIVFLIVFFSFFHKTNAQLSNKHFIPPLTNAGTGNANPENHYFYISTPNIQNVNFTIKQIGLTDANNITGIVNNATPQEIFIGNGVTQLFQESNQTSTITNNKGYIIESDLAIYVSVRILAGDNRQAGALVSKGNSAQGTTFRAGMFTNENPQTNYLNFISVMATEDNTAVQFSELPAGISIENYTGTTPIDVVLNEGESYIVATNSATNLRNRDGLIGTLIESNLPIVVNTGSANGSFHNGDGRDYGIDQIVGLDNVGSEYIFVKGGGTNDWENVLIVAHEDNTNMLINGITLPTILSSGEYYLIEGDRFDTNGNLYIETNKKVFAYQGIGATDSEANQGLFFVPPLSCENRGQVDNIPLIDKIGTTTLTGGITVVTNKGATIEINGVLITDASLNTTGPFEVNGTDYETYKVLDLSGNIKIEGSGELYCAYFNQNGAASSGSFYSGFTSNPQIDFQTSVGSLGNCIPNITLSAANTSSFDRFEWLYDDGSGFTSIRLAIDPTFAPSLPGNYKLIGLLDCSGSQYESAIITVSICPDDADRDLVIDNLDIDIDNDGILNCEESNGNAVLDISDINNPSIVFLDGNSNAAIVSSLVSGSDGTIIGTNTGNFQTSINTDINSNSDYELMFTENINFKIIQNTALDHVVSAGEFFIIKIGPNNKNITLLDPEDQLLVDTDYDGVFEAGVTEISSSEIHFKYVTNTTGTNSSYSFVANQVTNIEFKHLNAGISTVANFNGNISFTCFSRDSDGDGIEDAFDLDADNDGIRDLYEVTGGNSILTSIDSNADGLDDFFDTVATNLDTDLDGVLNFLDVDSDNDGIYDLMESGLTPSQVAVLDTNNDGVIDTLVDTNNNGLHDDLETLTTMDTDTDGIPNFLDLDADADTCFDVIEAGFTDSNNDRLLGGMPLTVNQNGKVISGTDGYTTPNLDYITAAPIEINRPFENQFFCELESNTLTIDTNAEDFQWQVSTNGGTTWTNIVNDLIYSNVTTTAIQITTTPLSFHNNQYRVVLGKIGNACSFTSNPVTLSVNALPIANEPLDIEYCDTDRDGFHNFDFDTVITPQILNLQSSTDFNVLYFNSFAAANANITGTNIVGAYTNTTAFTLETIYVRIQNSANTNCSAIVDFTISVIDVASPNQPSIYPLCDDNESGSNYDLITNNFLLNTKDNEILGSTNSNLDFVISYHTSALGALTSATSDVIDKTAPYVVTDTQNIFVRIENRNNQNCFVSSEDSVGSIFTSFELKVEPLPSILFSVELKQCDDDTDGFSDFNLNGATADISANFGNETFVFYPTLLDAENDTNAFTNAEAITFRNRTVTTDTIWTRAISNFGCFRIAEVNLVVSTTGLPVSFQHNFSTCDDFLNTDGNDNINNDDTDGVSTFDFSSVTSEVVAIFPTKQQLTIAYYRNRADALAELNAITDIANYRNIGYPNMQQIYIRVDSDLDNDCLGFGPYITLNVDRVPLANNLSQPFSFCDDFISGASDDGENIGINLRSTVNNILGTSQTETDFVVSYYTSQIDATSGTNPIVNDTDFRNTVPAGFVSGTVSRQTIFVRVEDRNKTPTCFNDHLSFDIEIKPLPKLQNTIDAIEVCDVPTPSDSDTRNRVAQNIDVSIRNNDILNGRDSNVFAVRYYKLEAEALNDLNRLTQANLKNYQNDPANTFFPADINSHDPGVETLFFTVTDLSSGCSSEPYTLDIRVYPEPNIPININNYIDCDTDNNGIGDDTDGILENIAFSSKVPEVLANYTTAAQSNFTVTFHQTLTAAQTGTDPLNTNTYTNLRNNQVIFVRVLNNQTGCVSDDLSFQIISNPLPSYDPLDFSQILCPNNLPLVLQVDNPLSAYNYSWIENASGNEISTAQSVDIGAGGTYTLSVTDINTMCNRTEQFEVVESESAIITSDNVIVIDETSDISGNGFSITINPDGLGIGDYEYALLDDQGNFVGGYQDELFFNQLTGGFYTLLVRDKDGCDLNGNPASMEVSVVEFPDFFTPNGDGINDLWTIKGANSNYYPSSEINIYNRFGGIVAKLDLNEEGWDGTYNGKNLPSTDYWVSIKLVPFDTTKKIIVKTANFSLLRK